MHRMSLYRTAGLLLPLILALQCCAATPQPVVIRPVATKAPPTEVFDVAMLTAVAQLAVEIEVRADGIVALGASIVFGPVKANSALADLSVSARAGDKVLHEYVMPDPRLGESENREVVLDSAQTYAYAPLSPDLTELVIAPVPGREGISPAGTIELPPLLVLACRQQPRLAECQEILKNRPQIQVVLAGKPLDSAEAQKALLVGVAWEKYVSAAFDGRDVAVVVQLWQQGELSPDARQNEFVPDQAARLLAEAGFPNGFGAWLVFPGDDAELSRFAELMIESLTSLAIQVETVPVDAAEAEAVVKRGVEGGMAVIWLSR